MIDIEMSLLSRDDLVADKGDGRGGCCGCERSAKRGGSGSGSGSGFVITTEAPPADQPPTPFPSSSRQTTNLAVW